MNHPPNLMSLISGDSDPLYEHYNNNTDNFGANCYSDLWLAQTFTSPITHLIQKICLKAYHIGIAPKVATIAIRATDGAGKPDGFDLTYITFNTHLFKRNAPAEWQCIEIPEYKILAGVQYAIIIRVPAAGVGGRLVIRLNTAGTYPSGTACDSNDGGVAWTIKAPWDYQFEEWGITPPPPPPLAPPAKWACHDIIATCLADGYQFYGGTNKPVHLWLRLTNNPTRKHLSSEIVRGEAKMTDLKFCFTVYHDIEQEEAGDTLGHTFIVRDWPVPEKRFFYLIGTINEEPSPSTSNIFTYHFPPKPYRNQLVATPTSSERCYTNHGPVAIFYPPMDYRISRLGACLSKQSIDDPPQYPEYFYVQVREGDDLDECGLLLENVYVPPALIPVKPNFKWFVHDISGIKLYKGQPYALTIKTSEPFGSTRWGLAARIILDECIMSPTLAEVYTAANPCQPATGNVSPLFLCTSGFVPTPKGEFVI